MKNKRINKNKLKEFLIGVLTVLLLIILAGGYKKFVKDDPASVSQEQQQSAEQADVDAAKQRVEEEAQDEPLKDNDNQQDNPITSDSISLSDFVFSQSDGLVKSSVNLNGAESGICTFVYTDGDGRAISKAAKLSEGRCSVSSPEAEFTMIGEYNLSVRFGGKSLSKTVYIN